MLIQQITCRPYKQHVLAFSEMLQLSDAFQMMCLSTFIRGLMNSSIWLESFACLCLSRVPARWKTQPAVVLGLGSDCIFCWLLRANGTSRGSCGLCQRLHLWILNVRVCGWVWEGGVGRTGRKREGTEVRDTGFSLSGVKCSFHTCLAFGQRANLMRVGVSGV